jgi:hypothetical protein
LQNWRNCELHHDHPCPQLANQRSATALLLTLAVVLGTSACSSLTKSRSTLLKLWRPPYERQL